MTAKSAPYPPCTVTAFWPASWRVPGLYPVLASGNTTSPYCRAVSGNAETINTMKVLQFILLLSILQVSTLFSQTDDEYVTITIVDQMPIFKNGNSEDFLIWLYNNLKYPQSAIRDSISGKVIARFKIDTLGVVSDIEIIRGVRVDLDQESIRVLSDSPNWIPARQGYNNVSVYYSIPVIFEINDQFFNDRIRSLSKNSRILNNKHNR